jgi:hypothetical protein
MVVPQMLRKMVLTSETSLSNSAAVDNQAIVLLVKAPAMHTLEVPILVRFARKGR